MLHDMGLLCLYDMAGASYMHVNAVDASHSLPAWHAMPAVAHNSRLILCIIACCIAAVCSQ